MEAQNALLDGYYQEYERSPEVISQILLSGDPLENLAYGCRDDSLILGSATMELPAGEAGRLAYNQNHNHEIMSQLPLIGGS
jgi:hypothetical protein